MSEPATPLPWQLKGMSDDRSDKCTYCGFAECPCCGRDWNTELAKLREQSDAFITHSVRLEDQLAATQDTVERLKQEIEAWIRLNCNSEFTKPWAESLTETLAAALEEPTGEQA